MSQINQWKVIVPIWILIQRTRNYINKFVSIRLILITIYMLHVLLILLYLFVTAFYHIWHSFVKGNVVYRYSCAEGSFVVCGLTNSVTAVSFRENTFEIWSKWKYAFGAIFSSLIVTFLISNNFTKTLPNHNINTCITFHLYFYINQIEI